MASLTIFANFLIDTDERLLRMQDSFHSFASVSADRWVVNARGRRARKAMGFLAARLGERLHTHRLDSDAGWFHDTRKMLPDINGDYVLWWLEDHVNLADPATLDAVVDEMAESRLDTLMYSFWWGGRLRDRYRGVDLNPGRLLDWFVHDENANTIIQHNAPEGVFLIAGCSIFRRELFQRIVTTDDPNPSRWPVATPFDFEKRPEDVHWLPLRVGLTKQELFASIDDDHVHPGTCLIARGLYPNRQARQTYTSPRTPLVVRALRRFRRLLG